MLCKISNKWFEVENSMVHENIVEKKMTQLLTYTTGYPNVSGIVLRWTAKVSAT